MNLHWGHLGTRHFQIALCEP